MKRIVMFAICAAITAPALSSPRYLECTGAGDSASWKLAVAVSEDQQIVTSRWNEAELWTRSEALFSPTLLQWRSTIGNFQKEIVIINRTTLAIAIVEQLGSKVTTKTGKCIVAAIPKQAF